MKALLVLLSILTLSGCLTTGEGGKLLPSGRGSRNQAASQKSVNKYHLPDKFNCFKPGTKGSKPGPFNEFQCMVCNCVHESGHEKHEGKVAVGRVVLSRLANKHYPSRGVCDVIYQKSQFSWTNGSRKERLNMPYHSAKSNYTGQVQQCKKAMIDTYENHTTKAFATSYWSPCGMCAIRGYKNCSRCPAWAKNPKWAKNCRGQKRIGNHIFCMGGVGGVYPEAPRTKAVPQYGAGALAYCPIGDFSNEI